ncbi:hypothetical protein SKUL_20 [Pseudomonas phage Skulduggery]|uniref:Uncharacterized protein n=1 Tax=Pseudomonas phage Skulduggery TaxID=2006671 RepID=A0A1Y0T004_9CAUD|nr:tail protein [Pseudomonas phage Skulduggery]ARV77119.1 hypothetical protein SKUL_20 [Pseudomonas phage Skulduggery]
MRRIKVPINLALPAVGPVAVRYQTRDGTAIAGRDYFHSHGFIQFNKGDIVRHVLIETVRTDAEGVFYLDLFDPVNGTIGKPDSTITIVASQQAADLTEVVKGMLSANFGFIQRATGSTIANGGMPELITKEGLVRNNQFVGGALGGYTPDGTASSEGIALLMRGIARAYAVTKAPEQLEYLKFLMDATCRVFFRGARPSSEPHQNWWHSWLANATVPFDVRGPIPADGDLALTGYVAQRDPESRVTFVDGVGIIDPPPQIVFQVVTTDAELVWPNVFSELVKGERVDVDYYINTYGNRVHGVQKTGSFGQPIDEVSGETPGKIVLKQKLNGEYLVNFCVTVPGVAIANEELYEAWPMWRKMYPNEVSTAADALHWFFDAFDTAAEAEPGNLEWRLARERILDAWRLCCAQESNNTTIFQAGADGPYNNFPLTYAYAYGRENVDDPASAWTAAPPTSRFLAARGSDGYVQFTLPTTNGAPGSGLPIRYGMGFENSPMFLNYEPQASVSFDLQADKPLVVSAQITDKAGKQFTAGVLVPEKKEPLELGVRSFVRFQGEPGDGTGDKTGDWSSDDDYIPPEYEAVKFPGRQMALVGDSLTAMCNVHIPVKTDSDRYESFTFGNCGFWTYCAMLGGHRLSLEPGVNPNVNGKFSGFNFGIAGTKTESWWLEEDDTLGDGVYNMGPMFAALKAINLYNCVAICGGTNDLSANITAPKVLNRLKKACYELASQGKWVFISTIPPRTTALLKGYTLQQQDVIRERLLTVNQGLRDWIATDKPPNIWLVDVFPLLVGPNGIDPAGWVSDRLNADGMHTPGNYRPEAPGVTFCYDGLHMSQPGAYLWGKELNRVQIAAGVTPRPDGTVGDITLGANKIPNPGMIFTTTQPVKMSNILGRAIGLGAPLYDATHKPITPAIKDKFQNRGLGYTNGSVPDYWFFYRSSNLDEESYSNFGSYVWGDLAAEFPQLVPYMAESTWADGAAKFSVVTVDGKKGIKVEFSVPQTGNKNESFVVRVMLPRGQHGPWDEFSYGLPETDPQYGEGYRRNTEYFAGQFVSAEAELRIVKPINVHTHRVSKSFMTIDYAAVGAGDTSSVGARISSSSMGPSFWPPSDIDIVRMLPQDVTLHARTPFIRAPRPTPNELHQYVQVNFEFGLDASSGPASVTAIILDPKLQIVSM